MMKRKHVRPLPWATPEQAKAQREALIAAGIVQPEGEEKWQVSVAFTSAQELEADNG